MIYTGDIVVATGNETYTELQLNTRAHEPALAYKKTVGWEALV